MLREITPEAPEFQHFKNALTHAALPTDDLLSRPFRYFSADDLAWGGIGLGNDALLRSIVVLPAARHRGFGRLVTEGLVDHARTSGVERLWLLTTNASEFFAALGWRQCDRSLAPPPIAQSRQFSSLCPASAALMVRTL